MTINETQLEAVLTGDMVGSYRLPDALFMDLAARIEAMALAMEGVELNGFYKGNDGFQCRIPDAAQGLRLALKMRTAAIGIGVDGEGVPLTDLRISIGIGPLAEAGPSERRTLGAAWVLSGRGFESLKRGERRLWVEGKDTRTNLAFEGGLPFYRLHPLKTDRCTPQSLPPPSILYRRIAEANWLLLVSMSSMFTLSAFCLASSTST